MAEDTDWFAEQEERKEERCFWRRVGFGLFLAIAAALILLPMMAGCATTPPTEEPKICFTKALGRTADGMVVVAQQCMTQEAFSELQK